MLVRCGMRVLVRSDELVLVITGLLMLSRCERLGVVPADRRMAGLGRHVVLMLPGGVTRCSVSVTLVHGLCGDVRRSVTVSLVRGFGMCGRGLIPTNRIREDIAG